MLSIVGSDQVQLTKQRLGKRKHPLRALVVEGEVELAESLCDELREWGASVLCVTTLREAIAACAQPFELLVLDLQLPDGSGVALAELVVRARPAPMVLGVGMPHSARDAFRLAQLGAIGFLQKPVARGELDQVLEQLVEQEPDYLPHMVSIVGRVGFREVLDRVRRSMAEQALAMAAGNKTGAARLLGITRQAVQQLIRDLDLNDSSQRPPPGEVEQPTAAEACSTSGGQ
ncbi:MAG TPA: response regulator [Polyangiales bacterium]|nr:response regulator [Polyangiales bacterium]